MIDSCFSFLHLVFLILCQWKTSTNVSLHNVIMNLILEIRVQKVLQLELLLWLDKLGCLPVKYEGNMKTWLALLLAATHEYLFSLNRDLEQSFSNFWQSPCFLPDCSAEIYSAIRFQYGDRLGLKCLMWSRKKGLEKNKCRTYVRKISNSSPTRPYPTRGDSCISQIARRRQDFPSIPNVNK